MSDHAAIINFWRAVETFEPQKVAKPSLKNSEERIFAVQRDEPLPWQAAASSRRQFQKTESGKINYRIYGGVFRVKRLKELFDEMFDDDSPIFDDRHDGDAAAFTFTVNELGQPLPGTFALSSCAWITGKTRRDGHKAADWLEGFDRAESEFAEKFEERMATLARRQSAASSDDSLEDNAANDDAPNDDEKRVEAMPILTFEDLLVEAKRVCENLNVQDLIEQPTEIRIKEFAARRSENAYDDTDFLNSFFYRDLGRVAAEVRHGNYGEGLKRYLASDTDLNLSERVDLRQSPDAAFRQLSPALFSPGRWAAQDKPPAFSQQIALNSMWQELANDSGLFAVNGPPGTGKTTLLRDLIAAVVVERAVKLAAYANPRRAFAESGVSWERTDAQKSKTHRLLRVPEELKNFGIVVASSNNGAVENISLELPAEKEIDRDWRAACDYFSSVAVNLTKDAKKNFPGKPAWGLAAAKLGNSQNRADFVSRFWFDAEGFKSELNSEATDDECWQEQWKKAVADFRAARTNEQTLRAARAKLYDEMRERPRLLEKLDELPARRENLTARLSNFELKKRRKEDDLNTLNETLRELSEKERAHAENRPSWFSVLLSFGRKRREWQAENARLSKLLAAQKDKISDAEYDLSRIRADRAKVAAELEKSENLSRTIKRRIEEINRNLEKAQTEWGERFLTDAQWFKAENEIGRELSSPWADAEWSAARIRLFAAALQLHKAFVYANARKIYRNLDAFVDLLKGQINFQTAISNGASDVWATFFLVVPVVSTTFASFDKLFAALRREEIGWLLVDEAGQAVPQAAAGAIWRARRAVLVGDPLQLEPVVTIPRKMQKILARKYAVGETWLPADTSAQELADKANRLGTYLNARGKRIWVGSPLRVHRRCLNPMFSIANRIAYDGLMIYGTSPEKENATPLPPSRWFDVTSAKSEGNWIPAETDETEKLIQELIKDEVSPSAIYLVSPFAHVADRLKKLGGQYGIYTDQQRHAGTIHTTQGRQAEVVILVLGGNPSGNGARDWAASKPNLLNVAVSRAQRRLYVVGDKQAWQKRAYFKTAIAELQNYFDASKGLDG